MNKVKVSVYESRPGVEVPVPQLLGKKKGPRTFRLGLQHLPLFILYVFVLRWCLATAGQPYQTALREYEATHGNGTLGVGALGVAGGPSVVRKSDGVDFGADAFDAWGTDDFVATGEGEDQERFEEEEEEEEEGSERVLNNTPEDLNNGTAASWDDGWEEDEGPQLPSSFLPDFWAVFALLVTILSHALLELSQHWSIDFKTFVQYKRVPHFKEGAYVKVVPRDPHSTAEIVRVEQSTKYKVKGSPVLWFSSHKRKYEVVDNQIKKVQMPKKLTVQEYVSSNGYTGGDAILIAEERFGPNKFEIPMPTFSDLYIRQILSPMSVFQVFCVGLWLLDSAWKYALFGLFSVFGFEATSVVTRLKNIQMIRGMGNISQDIYVYRMGKWIKTSTKALLPGDIVSIKRLNTSSGEVVPCDCLLLSGRAIMNEATLTGESVPQMKEAVSSDQSSWGRQLDIKGSDKIHVLFGGTSILQQSPGANESSKFETPDGGCACYVLRTGFSSSQGKLVRMIELSSSGSQASNKDFLKESVYMICLLLIFAIFASSYVLQKGFEDKNRTRYELLIHCILIVTSVVPADLPMQLAIAVNASLIHLVRINIFCTEPFRVPLAGKIDSCFFDKTGTITTDQLEATGIVPPKLDEASSSNSGSSSGAATGEKVPMISAPLESCRVIAGCHSLLQVEGKTLGDPVESAALKSIGWEYNQDSQKASPAKSEESRSYSSYESVRIIHRYHFSSKLQRMSTVVHVDSPGPSSGYLVCTKGSPEMIATLLAEDGGSKPKWYDATYQKLAREGMRVIALAYREVTTLDDGKAIDAGCEKSVVKAPRSWAEANLKFAGFVAFRCLMRKDSKEVIDLLLKSDHHVAMITGDNILTALHVACDVGLSEKKREDILLLEKMESEPYLQWISSATEAAVCDFELSKVESLAKDHDLCITGKTLEHAFTLQGDKLGSVLQYFKVFARMAPENKEKVLSCLNNLKRTTLMCGDGANDVGALRQAHVGVALLGGFGSLNADRENKDKKDGDKAIEKKEEKDESDGKELGFFERFQKQMEEAQEKTKKLQEERSKRMEVMKDRKEKNQIKVKERKEKMMKDVEEETRRLIAEGHNSFTASVRAMKNVVKKHQEEGKQKVADAGGSFAFSAAALAAREDGLEEGELPMLKLGDASIAAPFTSKFPSIRSVYDIIRQGRCTLVTSVQNNQIMCLTSLISSYSLSVLYLDGIKFSDYQMTATGILLTASHLSVSHVKPLKKISAIRPLTSMFHPALFLSLLGQFAIHLTCMIIAVRDAKAYMDPDFKQEMHGKFEANLINTTVFFIETMQQVSVLMVNYKGRPFQPGLDENKPLLHSLGMSCIGLFVLAYELFPPINNLLELYSFPSDAFRWKMITILAFDVIGALVWDRLMHAIFARKLFIASQNQADFTTVARGCFKVLASTLSMYLLFNGSGMMGLGLIFFLYRNGFF